MSSYRGYVEILRALLEHGADIGAKTNVSEKIDGDNDDNNNNVDSDDDDH